MNKKKPFLIIALAVAVGVGIYMLVSSTATRTQIPDIMSYYSWAIPVDELDKALLTDGRMTEKSCELIDHALEGYEAGSEDALRLAAYAQMRTKNGYPEETARRNLTEQIAAINVEEYSDTSVFKTLFQEAPWTMELVLEKYRGTEGYSARSVLKSIAENSSGLSLEERLQWALTIENTEYTGADFFSASVTEADLPRVRTLVTELTDPEQRRLCGQALADLPNQPEEIVPVLYQLRQQDLSLGEIFPQGIRLNMDLSNLNRLQDLPEMKDPLPAESRYLIISRTEVDVKAEELDKRPDDGYSCHNKSDPSVFDVRVETAWMDQMSLDQLPASYEEYQWLAVLDMQYIYGGCLTELKDYATGKVERNQHFYPVYGTLSRLILVERDGLVPRQLFESQSVDADKSQTVYRWTNMAVGSSFSSYQVAPRFDSEWKNEVLRRFLDRE